MSTKIATLDIISLDEKGRGIALYNNKKVYVNYAIPGDKVKVKIKPIFKRGFVNYYEGKIVEILSEGEGRIKPKCKYFGLCGGCRFQNWDYKYQLKFKKWLIEKYFSKWNLKCEILDVIPSPKIFYYRNRMDYSISYDGKIGLKKYGSWKEIVDIEECFLLSEEGNKIIKIVKDIISKSNIPGWDLIKHEGLLRYLIIREGKFTKERMVYFIVGKDDFKKLEEIKNALISENVATSIVYGINSSPIDVSFAKNIVFAFGNDHLKEKINDIIFHIHPNAFFQSNSYLASRLAEEVIKRARDGYRALDLYSGVGFFTLFLSKSFKEVIGIEAEEEAIKSANINAKLNEISNVKFIAAKVEDIEKFENVDVIIIDPPRQGMTRKARKAILNINPKRIIYVSCNPESMARDISKMKGYKISEPIQPIDMFPQTPHIELVATLERI